MIESSRLNLVIFIGLAVALAVAGLIASSLSGTPLIGYDDANIFFVYARNFVGGHGLVYYPGGERVEGFSSPLWLLICSAATALTPRFESALFAISAIVVGIGATATVSYLIDVLVRCAGFDRKRAIPLSLLLVTAIALSPGFVAWNILSLMDSGLWAALLMLSIVAVLRSALDGNAAWNRMLPLLLALMVLTRPEALVWAPALVFVSIALRMMGGEKPIAASVRHVPAVAAVGLTIAATFVARLGYFGYAFPNTYYAKVGDPLGPRMVAGATYFADFAILNPAIPLAIVAGIATSVMLARRFHSAPSQAGLQLLMMQAGLVLILILGCVVPILEGGDHFGFWRMYQPVVPLAAVQAVLTIATLAVGTAPKIRLSVLAVAIIATLMPWLQWTALDQLAYRSVLAPGGAWNTPAVEIGIAEDMRAIGTAFDQAFPADKPSVGVIVAGGFALNYHGPTIDLMGLNNVAMAHSTGPRYGMRDHAAFDPGVFFKLAPDVLLLSLWSPERPDWFGFPMLSGVFDAPPNLQGGYFERRAASMAAFDAGILKGLLQHIGDQYAWASVRPASGGRWLHAVFRRDLLKRLGDQRFEIAMPGPPPAR